MWLGIASVVEGTTGLWLSHMVCHEVPASVAHDLCRADYVPPAGTCAVRSPAMPIDPAVRSPYADEDVDLNAQVRAAIAHSEEIRAESAALRLTAQLTIAELRAIREDAERSWQLAHQARRGDG
jgi:hypothetical protein